MPLPKSGKPRYIALSDAAVALFESLPRQDGDALQDLQATGHAGIDVEGKSVIDSPHFNPVVACCAT